MALPAPANGRAPGGLWLIAVLGAYDLRFRIRGAAILTAIVASTVAPIMLLLGLKAGTVGAMQALLLNDPRTLEIVMVAARPFERRWLAQLAADPRVAYVTARTRAIDPTIDILTHAGGVATLVEMVATSPGDPLLPPAAPGAASPAGVWISASLARNLRLSSGERLTGIVRRTLDERPQSSALTLEVIGVLPAAAHPYDAVFVTLDLAVAAEHYRAGILDAIGDPARWSGIAEQETSFANARLYAASLGAVAPLTTALAAQGIKTHAQTHRIQVLLDLERDLSGVLEVISLFAAVGGCLALASLLWSEIEQKRRDLACLQLYGFSITGVAILPVLQMLLLGLLGFAVAGALYLAGSTLFNVILETYAPGTAYRCALDTGGVLSVLAAILGTSLAASVGAAYHAATIPPAEALRLG